ncbi:MAG: hypothetical protein M1308_18450, partial [Actinobacteria bacterium]|nr:hypothetical protein [Actinomycetota bacterium]
MESNYKTQTGWIVFSQLLLIMMLVSSMSNSRLLLIVFLAACMITFFKPVYLLPCSLPNNLGR